MWWLWAWSACGPEPRGTDREPVATGDTGPSEATHTGTPPDAEPPTSIAAACSPTDNALRMDCRVRVEPPQAVRIRYVRADGRSVERSVDGPGRSVNHVVRVPLLAPEQAYTFVATAAAWPEGAAATGSFVTGRAPSGVASRLEATGTSTMGLVGGDTPCGSSANAVIWDTATGDLVWYQDLDPAGVLGLDAMVRFEDDRTVLAETDGQIVRVDLDGHDLFRFDLDYPGHWGLHHDIFERDGRIYLLHQEDVLPGLVMDVLWVVDETGATLAEWHAADHLEVPRGASGDFLHTNSIDVDEVGDVYLSFLAQDTVVKVLGDLEDPAFGQVLWRLAGHPPNDIGGDVALDWSRVAGPDFFDHQHTFHRRRDGRFTLLDNRSGRGLVLAIDQAGHAATVEGAYATHEPDCGPQGTATDTLAGNVVVGCHGPWLREYDGGTGELVWEAEAVCSGSAENPSVTRFYALDAW